MLLAFLRYVKVIAFILLSALPITLLHAEGSASVGVVNVTFLMENAPQAEIASAELKKKFLPQEKKLADDLDAINALSVELEKDPSIQVSTEIKRQKERELRSRKRARSRLLQDFREELRFARDAALDDVQKEVFVAINDVREQENIDIVLQDYVSAAQRVDITSLVLKHLQNKLQESPSPSNNESTAEKEQLGDKK